tara:strand:- start:215 stop:376 length:162 start_codon:yes stop_codon:yes gene_type:complete
MHATWSSMALNPVYFYFLVLKKPDPKLDYWEISIIEIMALFDLLIFKEPGFKY